ncbi:helix-turn-helix domain-containing protein [Nocardia tengchongensis]|uniref:helix-turn-helix domain-containing protein n=1 Tax=Nocardia tengchongensis TaxID=2055889 RepID=UPI0036763A04
MLDWDVARNTSDVQISTRRTEERGASAGECLPSLPGPLVLALLASRTLRDAIVVAVGYVDHGFTIGQLKFENADGEGRLQFEDREASADGRDLLAERVLAGFQAVGHELYGIGVPLRRVSFRHSAPADITRYRSVFGIEPLFGTTVNELAFDSSYLDVPLPHPTEQARSTCQRMCQELLARRYVRSGFAGVVRDLLVRDPGVIPDQSAVASELFVSPRTLSRRLNEEGTSFRTLLDEVRQVLSEELLDRTDMTTEQVAARLGYAEAASFIRAFRRWQGCPPQEYRARGRTPELV